MQEWFVQITLLLCSHEWFSFRRYFDVRFEMYKVWNTKIIETWMLYWVCVIWILVRSMYISNKYDHKKRYYIPIKQHVVTLCLLISTQGKAVLLYSNVIVRSLSKFARYNCKQSVHWCFDVLIQYGLLLSLRLCLGFRTHFTFTRIADRSGIRETHHSVHWLYE